MFHIGQKVVCVYDYSTLSPSDKGYGDEKYPVLGNVYIIRGFVTEMEPAGLVFEEIGNSMYAYKAIPSGRIGCFETCFHPSRFRPVIERKTDISVFKKMLVPEMEGSMSS